MATKMFVRPQLKPSHVLVPVKMESGSVAAVGALAVGDMDLVVNEDDVIQIGLAGPQPFGGLDWSGGMVGGPDWSGWPPAVFHSLTILVFRSVTILIHVVIFYGWWSRLVWLASSRFSKCCNSRNCIILAQNSWSSNGIAPVWEARKRPNGKVDVPGIASKLMVFIYFDFSAWSHATTQKSQSIEKPSI